MVIYVFKADFSPRWNAQATTGEIKITIKHDSQKKNLDITIVTPNLVLNNLKNTSEERNFYKELCGDPITMSKFEDCKVWSEEYIQEQLTQYEEAASSGEIYNCGFLISTHDGIPLGHLGFDPEKNNTVDMGYIIKREFWGKGLASEAANAAVRYFLKAANILKFTYRGKPFENLYFTARHDNTASNKIIEGFGIKPYKKEIKYGDLRSHYILHLFDYRHALIIRIVDELKQRLSQGNGNFDPNQTLLTLKELMHYFKDPEPKFDLDPKDTIYLQILQHIEDKFIEEYIKPSYEEYLLMCNRNFHSHDNSFILEIKEQIEIYLPRLTKNENWFSIIKKMANTEKKLLNEELDPMDSPLTETYKSSVHDGKKDTVLDLEDSDEKGHYIQDIFEYLNFDNQVSLTSKDSTTLVAELKSLLDIAANAQIELGPVPESKNRLSSPLSAAITGDESFGHTLSKNNKGEAAYFLPNSNSKFNNSQ